MQSLKQAIQKNRQKFKAKSLLQKIRLKKFDYEDNGKTKKANRIIEKLKTIIER